MQLYARRLFTSDGLCRANANSKIPMTAAIQAYKLEFTNVKNKSAGKTIGKQREELKPLIRNDGGYDFTTLKITCAQDFNKFERRGLIAMNTKIKGDGHWYVNTAYTCIPQYQKFIFQTVMAIIALRALVSPKSFPA